MDRIKVSCEIAQKAVELQFDIKKIPGEIGPCYMVSIDGLFKGYITRDSAGHFNRLSNSDFAEEELNIINHHLGAK